MSFTSMLAKIGVVLVALVCGLFACAALSTISWIQPNIFYAHKIPIWCGQRLETPETFGFLPRQVVPFRIATPDGESLFAWLITPLTLYAQHAREFRAESRMKEVSVTDSLSFQLLKKDPEIRLIVYLHGNAGSIGQTRRVDAYRTITTGLSEPTYVLAFDYRGFSKSTGSPSENGLIKDAVSVIDWATKVANIAPERILLVAQSLGTAVAAAAANQLLTRNPRIELAGLLLCGAFFDAPGLFLSYSVGGVVPIFAPLRLHNLTKTWFIRRIKDQWQTHERIKNIVKRSKRLRLILVHARNDKVIPYQQLDQLFEVATAALRLPASQTVRDITRSGVFGDGSKLTVCQSGEKEIRSRLVNWGGHNEIMKKSSVALAVREAFRN